MEERRDNSLLLEIKEGVAVLTERVTNYHSELTEVKGDVEKLEIRQTSSEKFQWKVVGIVTFLIAIATITAPWVQATILGK